MLTCIVVFGPLLVVACFGLGLGFLADHLGALREARRGYVRQ